MNECIFNIEKIKDEFRNLGGNVYENIVSPTCKINGNYITASTFKLVELLDQEHLQGIVEDNVGGGLI